MLGTYEAGISCAVLLFHHHPEDSVPLCVYTHTLTILLSVLSEHSSFLKFSCHTWTASSKGQNPPSSPPIGCLSFRDQGPEICCHCCSFTFCIRPGICKPKICKPHNFWWEWTGQACYDPFGHRLRWPQNKTGKWLQPLHIQKALLHRSSRKRFLLGKIHCHHPPKIVLGIRLFQLFAWKLIVSSSWTITEGYFVAEVILREFLRPVSGEYWF